MSEIGEIPIEKPTFAKPDKPKLHMPVPLVEQSEFGTTSLEANIKRMLSAASEVQADGTTRSVAGLASNQLEENIDKSIILIDLEEGRKKRKPEDLTVIMNAKITYQSVETNQDNMQGCISTMLPDGRFVCAIPPIPNEITLEGFNFHGNPVKYNLRGDAAGRAYHEVKHLAGEDITDFSPILHTVAPDEIQEYRTNFKNWPKEKEITKAQYDELVGISPQNV